ncbi:NUDIX domain-containing protein [Seinonella peptonophila]|uniref:NUDIX domain-containing protein n=1 Tax=Seinonella peptonophila TaxID=112248 RepID=A0A1M4Z5N4_9BACL|nr:NUDIX domain-containing protein [Seinonella peptonophila]SHF13268.1 NUDIX domain-containing protein [Seinonella peptonophila]
MIIKSIQQQINTYLNRFPDEKSSLTPLLNQVDQPNQLYHRKSLPGHITASGIILKGDRILMIYHPILKKWLQPGGHVEVGEVPFEAAIREVKEETGFRCQLHEWHCKNSIPIDIDIHQVPTNQDKQEPEHLHYDFRYLLTIDPFIETIVDGEHQWAWIKYESVQQHRPKEFVKKLLKYQLIL